MRKFVRAMCHPGAQSAMGSIMVLLLTIALVACGDDSGTSAPSDEPSCSSKTVSSSSNADSGTKSGMTSSSQKAVSSSSDAPASSSSKKVESSSSQKIASSSSTPRNDVSSSSAKVASSSSVSASSSSKKVESSSSLKNSSSSAKVVSSSSVAPASSSSKKVSSSSEYVPYDHFKCLADNWNLRDTIYKQFTDPRNGRSYYYYTAVSSKTGRKVTVMAENLNIGEMVLGENDQNDDTKIERYCYNNDITNCDKYGGLYQWAEMMQLPSSCNTESCSDWIETQHQGICPDGWRLFTWRDFEIIRDYNDQYGDGVKGLRSQCFHGNNASGFSLIGGGVRFENGTFKNLTDAVFWTYPQEQEYDVTLFAYSAFVSVNSDDNTGTQKNRRGEKSNGYSVRCVKIE
ncbi:FISUMP domain-containing protein [Fibrobacter sp. UBA4297]|uniref:FISUMP domain-containing protein n=1 Tax=Fibrobacter sp. UBA4297 TaxID=1946536 RepID=UPI0025BD22E2|nr:FISUMP domain-containing protein [Fibrobacter sp. UBA4297]